jgi:hypothetical protein
MTDRPDALDAAAAASLGDGAYPQSQVGYRGTTYWLERAGDGTKRLVAVAGDETAFAGFDGSVERRDRRVRLVAETSAENAAASVRRCPG